MSGTEGEAKRLEAIKIQLTGADKDKYDIYYRVHAQSYGLVGRRMAHQQELQVMQNVWKEFRL